MIFSENEIYQIIKKSCISEKIYEDWAEDIGRAISFLHTKNINGCGQFERLIKSKNSKQDTNIQNEGNKLFITNINPIKNAIPIVDWLTSSNNKKAIVTKQIISPLIFFALLVRSSINYGGEFNIHDQKKSIIYKINVNFKFFRINLLKGNFIINWLQSDILIKPKKLKKPIRNIHGVDLKTWKYLEKKAYKTYVPASTKSRESGAGAGLLDND